MYCRFVDQTRDLDLGCHTFYNDKVLELVDDEVGTFQVLEPVGKKIHLCKHEEALLDVHVVLGEWSRLFGPCFESLLRTVKNVRPGL
jgi:hypothetical protein